MYTLAVIIAVFRIVYFHTIFSVLFGLLFHDIHFDLIIKCANRLSEISFLLKIRLFLEKLFNELLNLIEKEKFKMTGHLLNSLAAQHLSQLYLQQELADVFFTFPAKTTAAAVEKVAAHKLILASGSPGKNGAVTVLNSRQNLFSAFFFLFGFQSDVLRSVKRSRHRRNSRFECQRIQRIFAISLFAESVIVDWKHR